jgi:hypothetical protein
VQGFVHSRIHKIITGPRMANAWVQVNRVASQALVAVLSGRGGNNGAVGVSNGQVTLDLAPLEAVAKQDLVARGLTIAAKIPIVHTKFALIPSKNLTKAQGVYRLINDLKIVLPIVTLALLGLGVFAARGHRRALIGAGSGSPRPCWCSAPAWRSPGLSTSTACQPARPRTPPQQPSTSWSGSSRPRFAPCSWWA